MTEKATHDAITRIFLERLRLIAVLLRERFPKDIGYSILPETVERLDPVFVKRAFSKIYEDLFFKVKTTNGLIEWIFIFFEHKSEPERDVAWQLFTYISAFWHQWRREHPNAKLPRIRTFVFFHGKDPWNVSNDFSALYEGSPEVEVTADDLNFRYRLINLWAIDDADLSQDPELRALLLLLKYTWWPDKLLGYVESALRMYKGNKEMLKELFRYLSWRMETKENYEKLEAIVRRTNEENMDTFYSYAEQLQDAAEGKGKVKGKAEVLLRLLQDRFKSVPSDVQERIWCATEAELDCWFGRILRARSINGVMAKA